MSICMYVACMMSAIALDQKHFVSSQPGSKSLLQTHLIGALVCPLMRFQNLYHVQLYMHVVL